MYSLINQKVPFTQFYRSYLDRNGKGIFLEELLTDKMVYYEPILDKKGHGD
jgi:hypothetical protein